MTSFVDVTKFRLTAKCMCLHRMRGDVQCRTYIGYTVTFYFSSLFFLTMIGNVSWLTDLVNTIYLLIAQHRCHRDRNFWFRTLTSGLEISAKTCCISQLNTNIGGNSFPYQFFCKICYSSAFLYGLEKYSYATKPHRSSCRIPGQWWFYHNPITTQSGIL